MIPEARSRGGAVGRPCLLLMAAWLVIVGAACAPVPAPFAGRYLADNRPHELIYLDLAQSGPAATGTLTLVTADDGLGTLVDTFDVRGGVERDVLTLAAERFPGRPTTTLALVRSAGGMSLTLPSYSGGDVTLLLVGATTDDLSRLVAAWSGELEDARRERDADAARAATLRRQADELDRALADIRTSTRRLRELTADARDAQVREQVRVESMAGFVGQLERDAVRSGDDLDARCSPGRRRRQAGDLLSLEGVFGGQGSRLSDAIERLESELATGRRLVALAQERMKLVEAGSPRGPSTLAPNGVPGEQARTLEANSAAAEQTRRDVEALRASEREQRARTADLLTKGRALLSDLPANADCRPPIVLPEPIPEEVPTTE